MPAKILELRKKISSTFNHSDSLTYVRTNWSAIDGKPLVYPPAGHTHPISQVTGLQSALDGKLNKRSGIIRSGVSSPDTQGLFGYMLTTASTAVGMEYNILLNAHRKGYTITQSGTGQLGSNVNSLFDGRLGPAYSSDGIDPNNPFVLLIEGLPDVHTQTGGVIGWTSRYWFPLRYKVEVYDSHNSVGWRTLVDNSNSPADTKDLVIPLFPSFSGSHTKIRITIYESAGGTLGPNGFKRWGLSEIFFIHPEAQRVHEYLDVEWANKLRTPRKINGVSFDGSSDINISAPASDVYSWAKASNKPSYNLGEISETTTYKRVTQSEKNIWNAKQDEIGYIPENIANKRASIRTTGADDSSYVTELGIKNYVDSIAATKQNELGFTPVPNTRTIAGLDLTENRSRDAIIGVNANGYVRRTGTNTYDVRTVENLKTDLGLGSAAYVTLNASNRFVTDSQITSWNNKFDKPSGTSSQYVTGNGSLATFPNVPTKLSQLSDVSSLVTPSNGQILTYNGLSWEASNKPSYNLGEISETTTYKRVTQTEKDNWNNKWKLIYSGPSSLLSETSATSVPVPSDIYADKTIAVEFRFASASGTTYQKFVAIATVGTSSNTSGSKTAPRYLTVSEWDGTYLKFLSTKCFASSTSAVTSLTFGYLKTLVGHFSGTTINWTTQANDDLSVYIGKIWVVE